jgi:hypothetical protein
MILYLKTKNFYFNIFMIEIIIHVFLFLNITNTIKLVLRVRQTVYLLGQFIDIIIVILKSWIK